MRSTRAGPAQEEGSRRRRTSATRARCASLTPSTWSHRRSRRRSRAVRGSRCQRGRRASREVEEGRDARCLRRARASTCSRATRPRASLRSSGREPAQKRGCESDREARDDRQEPKGSGRGTHVGRLVDVVGVDGGVAVLERRLDRVLDVLQEGEVSVVVVVPKPSKETRRTLK